MTEFFKNYNDFYLFIDFFNCSSVNKNRGKDLEDIIDEVGEFKSL